MKTSKTIRQTILAVILTAAASYSFAAPSDDLRNVVRTSFQHDFKNAHLISSETDKDFTKLTFDIDNNVFTAFYSPNGELLALARNIVSNNLPISLLMSLKKDYKKFWISDLYEMTKNGESHYYVTLENADEKLVLRSEDEEWTKYNQLEKE